MITLFTDCTPNGFKISIALEELELKYNYVEIDFSQGDQFKPEFKKMNLNCKIPVIVDSDNDDITIFESGAILQYLAEKEGKLLPKDSEKRIEVMQWLFWQMSGLGPYVGQLLVFAVAFEKKIPEAIERYFKESKRLLSVLNQRLENRDYVAAQQHTIADIAIFPWVRICHLYPLPISLCDYPNLERWYNRLEQRPAYQKGISIPPTPSKEARLKIFRSALI